MKIGRYNNGTSHDTAGPERLGVVLDSDTGPAAPVVLDLIAAMQAHSRLSQIPLTMDDFIDGGEAVLHAGYDAIEWARREGQDDWWTPEDAVPWMTPLNVRNCIAGGRNFAA